MENDRIIEELATISTQMKSCEKAISDLESNARVTQDIALSVKELATNMKHMYSEQKEQGCRLRELENKPRGRMDLIERTIITSVIAFAISMITVYFGK